MLLRSNGYVYMFIHRKALYKVYKYTELRLCSGRAQNLTACLTTTSFGFTYVNIQLTEKEKSLQVPQIRNKPEVNYISYS
jgi:hypothetical protein